MQENDDGNQNKSCDFYFYFCFSCILLHTTSKWRHSIGSSRIEVIYYSCICSYHWKFSERQIRFVFVFFLFFFCFLCLPVFDFSQCDFWWFQRIIQKIKYTIFDTHWLWAESWSAFTVSWFKMDNNIHIQCTRINCTVFFRWINSTDLDRNKKNLNI